MRDKVFSGYRAGVCQSEGVFGADFNGGLCNWTWQALYILLSAGRYYNVLTYGGELVMFLSEIWRRE